jgi:type IV pilus biogenesis protein CpaD/CtpE
MKQVCLLLVVVASIAGCASAPGSETGKAPAAERVSDAYVPIGTIIPRKRSERGMAAAPITEVDKQALENERLMNARK